MALTSDQLKVTHSISSLGRASPSPVACGHAPDGEPQPGGQDKAATVVGSTSWFGFTLYELFLSLPHYASV